MICWRCKFNKECDGLKIRSCKDFLPRTNGDHLREMTDEELAHFFYNLDSTMIAKDLPPHIAPSKEEWLDWLKQEVEA